MIWLETPRNPDVQIADIAAYVAAAHRLRLRVVVDSTFAPPPIQRYAGMSVSLLIVVQTSRVQGSTRDPARAGPWPLAPTW